MDSRFATGWLVLQYNLVDISRNVVKRTNSADNAVSYGMRIGEVLGLSWSDIDFAAKKNLLGELRRWQAQQVENEKQHGGSYVYIYRENDGHIQRQSKGLSAPCGEKVSLICTRADGRLVLRETFTKVLHGEGQTIRIREYTNHAESSHAQHAEITGRNGGDFRQYADIKAETP